MMRGIKRQGFWAARSYAKLGQYDDINFWLKRASQIK